MNRISLIALSFAFLFPLSATAMEHKTGGYKTTNKRVIKIIESDPHAAFAYGMLRRAEELKQSDFFNDANEIWSLFRDHDDEDESDEIHVEILSDLVIRHWDHLTSPQHNLALDLGLKKEGFFAWSEKKFGTMFTNTLKVLTPVAIVCSLVCTPTAAAISQSAVKGTFHNSCKNIRVNRYASLDPNLKGNLISIAADCAHDRADHGYKSNHITTWDDNDCQYVHNNNGTLVASDLEFSFQQRANNPSSPCPTIVGSLTKTCKSIEGSIYNSPYDGIPSGSVCQYAASCKNLKGDYVQSKSYIPIASVECKGRLSENCNGEVVLRGGHGSDHQCDIATGIPKDGL